MQDVRHVGIYSEGKFYYEIILSLVIYLILVRKSLEKCEIFPFGGRL